MRNGYESLFGSLKERDQSESLERDGDNIKTDVKEIDLEAVEWINLAQHMD